MPEFFKFSSKQKLLEVAGEAVGEKADRF